MKIVFRCDSCETINDIPEEYMFRFCRTCGKIITYTIGEAVIYDKRVSICEKFLNAQKLSVTLAEKFFVLAEEDENDISKSQLEKILLQLKKEGIVYQPKSWLVKLA